MKIVPYPYRTRAWWPQARVGSAQRPSRSGLPVRPAVEDPRVWPSTRSRRGFRPGGSREVCTRWCCGGASTRWPWSAPRCAGSTISTRDFRSASRHHTTSASSPWTRRMWRASGCCATSGAGGAGGSTATATHTSSSRGRWILSEPEARSAAPNTSSAGRAPPRRLRRAACYGTRCRAVSCGSGTWPRTSGSSFTSDWTVRSRRGDSAPATARPSSPRWPRRMLRWRRACQVSGACPGSSPTSGRCSE